MRLEENNIRKHRRFLDLIKMQSSSLMAVHEVQPRLASIFSCQDRWLMAHIGLSLYFDGLATPGADGLTTASFVKTVVSHKIASRNTATAFLNEMLNYGIIWRRPHATDRRMHVMAPAPTTLDALTFWIEVHLATLDMIDGGSRASRFHESPGAFLAHLQPAIAKGLLHDETIMRPDQAFAHFMWMTSGFLITERLILAVETIAGDRDHLPVMLSSVGELTAGLNLSRAHSARKINEAEKLGILGWIGTKGRSQMWVSRSFVLAFLDIQAAKLAVIDAAFAELALDGSSPPLAAVEQAPAVR